MLRKRKGEIISRHVKRLAHILNKYSFLKDLERRTRPNTFARSWLVDGTLKRLRAIFEFLLRTALYRVEKPSSLRALRALKGSKSGTVALIMANGPSLKKINTERVRELQSSGSLEVLVMNNFHTSGFIDSIEPNYAVLSDPNHIPDLAKFPRGPWTWISSSDVITFCPRTWNVPETICKPDKVVHFEDSSMELLTRNINPTKPRGYPSLTAFKSISIANYLGYDDIYIIGLDNSMFLTLEVDKHNHLYQRPNHSGSSGGEIDTFLSEFFPMGVADYFFDVANSSFALRTCFSKLKIFNLDENSYSDAFRKADPLGLTR